MSRPNEPAHDPRPLDLQVPIRGVVRRRLKRLEEKGYVVIDNSSTTGTLQFYVTRQAGKRYGGTISNEGSTNLTVQIETTRGYWGLPKTLPPGTYLFFEDFTLSGITIRGTGIFSLVAWAGKNALGKIAYYPQGNTLVGPIPGANHLVAPWYQPNFKFVSRVFTSSGTAPHATTSRFSYTVPAGRIAQVTHALVDMMRDGAPTTAGLAFSTIFENTIFSSFSEVEEIQAAVGNARSMVVGLSDLYPAGFVLVGQTSDASTGGTYRYRLFLTVMEFDA